MIIVIARAEVEPGHLPRVRDALGVLSRATWEESGCLSHSTAIESEETGVIIIVERWDDGTSMATHLASPHLATFKAAVDGAMRTIDAKVYDVTGERELTIDG